jgi:hypothetical protein
VALPYYFSSKAMISLKPFISMFSENILVWDQAGIWIAVISPYENKDKMEENDEGN